MNPARAPRALAHDDSACDDVMQGTSVIAESGDDKPYAEHHNEDSGHDQSGWQHFGHEESKRQHQEEWWIDQKMSQQGAPPCQRLALSASDDQTCRPLAERLPAKNGQPYEIDNSHDDRYEDADHLRAA